MDVMSLWTDLSAELAKEDGVDWDHLSADEKFAYEGRGERLLDQWETRCREVSPAQL